MYIYENKRKTTRNKALDYLPPLGAVDSPAPSLPPSLLSFSVARCSIRRAVARARWPIVSSSSRCRCVSLASSSVFFSVSKDATKALCSATFSSRSALLQSMLSSDYSSRAASSLRRRCSASNVAWAARSSSASCSALTMNFASMAMSMTLSVLSSFSSSELSVEGGVMSTHTPFHVDSVGPPRAEVCRTAASFPLSGSPKVYRTQGGRGQRYPSHATLQPQSKKSLVSPTHLIHLSDV